MSPDSSANPNPASARRQSRLAALQRPWTALDGLLSLFITIAVPAAVSIWLVLLTRQSIISQELYHAVTSEGVVASIFALSLGLVVEFGLLFYFVHHYKLTRVSFGIKQFSWKKAVLLIVLFYLFFAVTIYFVYLLVTVLIPSVNLDEAQKSGFEFGKSGVGVWISGLATIVLAPIIEEIYFRGFLLPAFSKKSFIVGALISSLFFGVLHFQLNVAIYTFVFGLFLCFLYYRLGSILPGIMLHMLNNLVAFLILLSIH